MPRRKLLRSGPTAHLRAIGTALRSATATTGEVSEALQPLPLDTVGGGVAAWKLEEIQGREQAALADGDYRLAAEMRDLHSVLSPEESTAERHDALLPPANDVEARARFFYRFGL
jgi:hypothetical protein